MNSRMAGREGREGANGRAQEIAGWRRKGTRQPRIVQVTRCRRVSMATATCCAESDEETVGTSPLSYTALSGHLLRFSASSVGSFQVKR